MNSHSSSLTLWLTPLDLPFATFYGSLQNARYLRKHLFASYQCIVNGIYCHCTLFDYHLKLYLIGVKTGLMELIQLSLRWNLFDLPWILLERLINLLDYRFLVSICQLSGGISQQTLDLKKMYWLWRPLLIFSLMALESGLVEVLIVTFRAQKHWYPRVISRFSSFYRNP